MILFWPFWPSFKWHQKGHILDILSGHAIKAIMAIFMIFAIIARPIMVFDTKFILPFPKLVSKPNAGARMN